MKLHRAFRFTYISQQLKLPILSKLLFSTYAPWWHPHHRGNKVLPSLFSAFLGQICPSDCLCRADLGQGHRSIHNQTTGHQNHHGPHSGHEGPYPHCGRPLLRRWVSLFVSFIWYYPPNSALRSRALSLARNLGRAEMACSHWFDSWGAMWWRLLIGWRAAEGCVSSVEARYWHRGASEEECCQLSLAERVPTGLALTQIARRVVAGRRNTWLMAWTRPKDGHLDTSSLMSGRLILLKPCNYELNLVYDSRQRKEWPSSSDAFI